MRRNLPLHRNPFLCGNAGRATIRSPDWPRNWGGWDPHPSQKISSQHRDRFDVTPVCAPYRPLLPLRARVAMQGLPLRRTKTWPIWHNGLKPHCAGQTAMRRQRLPSPPRSLNKMWHQAKNSPGQLRRRLARLRLAGVLRSRLRHRLLGMRQDPRAMRPRHPHSRGRSTTVSNRRWPAYWAGRGQELRLRGSIATGDLHPRLSPPRSRERSPS